jgi:NADH-quinone oxidoreductase subunit G
MEGASLQPPSALQPFFWTPGWNSIQAVNKFQSEIGGPLHGGDPGIRLFEPSQGGEYFTAVPAAFSRDEAEWMVLPIEHIFGSEELSLQAPGVAELAFKPYLALNAADAASLHLDENAGDVEIELGGVKQRLPLKVLPDLPAGVAGIPTGLTEAFGEEFPVWRRIERAT